MHSRCHCSDCRISSKLFPRNYEGRIILPQVAESREQYPAEYPAHQTSMDDDGSTSTESTPPMATPTRDTQDEQPMNISSRTRGKQKAHDQSKPTAHLEARQSGHSPPILPLPAPFSLAPSDQPLPSGSDVRTEFCPPVLAPQADGMLYNSERNNTPVRIRWNSRKSRQGFTLQESDGPKSRFRHYNAEST